MSLMTRMTGLRRITLPETSRALLLKDGRFATILGPGAHWLGPRSTSEVHDIAEPRFRSTYAEALRRERPDLVAAHLTDLRAGPDEVVVILRDGQPFDVLRPGARVLLWTDAGPWTTEAQPLAGVPVVAPAMAQRLVRAGLTSGFTTAEVPEGAVGVLLIDGRIAGTLEPGLHRFWLTGQKIALRPVDLRLRTLDVTGQEILTRDRVTLRVTLAASYRVTDPLRALSSVTDYAEALHRALQLAFRRTLGAMTLDQLLAEKVSVDAAAAEAVRSEMAGHGVEVGEIALKDVILPGEMRDILNRVVSAQKEAEANMIRRREETNATRSLLNTARVMAENPLMLRLRELEALETIAGRVERLTIHNGTAGLMTDLVKLAD